MTSGEGENAQLLTEVREAVDAAVREMAVGNNIGALHLLRSVRVPDGLAVMNIGRAEGRTVQLSMPGVLLVRRAIDAYLSLITGQWGDSPHHGPSSDTPHGVLTMYESLSPMLPEPNPELRLWMDHLRIAVAADHEHWPKVAAWALDLFTHAKDLGSANDELAGMANMAVAMSHLGYTDTANNLYQQVRSDERLRGANRAAVTLRIGSFLWNRGDKTNAEELYSAAIKAFEDLENPPVTARHDHVRALQRRSSCLIDRGDRGGALRDIDTAFKIVDEARRLGIYQAVRSVDAAIADDIRALLSQLGRIGLTDQDAPIAIGAFCRLANSAAAAASRIEPTTTKKIYTESKTDRSDIVARARMAVRWSVVSPEDVNLLMQSDTPVMIMAITDWWRLGATGITITTGAGLPPKMHHWRLDPDERPDDAALMQELRDLLTPPPGSAVAGDSGWSRPWHAPKLVRLASIIAPIDDLAARLDRSGNGELRILPVGAMWGFPYAAIPVGGMPLGSVVPIVLATGPGTNTAPPHTVRWAGHFDLSLPHALAELRDTFAVTRSAAVEFALFTNTTELATLKDHAGLASHIVFAGHGVLGRGQQRLRLATGEYCSSHDLSIFYPGASIVLNACWSGAVTDEIGSDPADLALSLIGEGAHSVLGPIGPVDDAYAAHFQRTCLHYLIAGQSVAESAHLAVRDRLATDADLPLSAWACYATIGRRAHFNTTSADRIPAK